MLKKYLLLVTSIFLFNCSGSTTYESKNDYQSFDVSYVKSNLEFLASDDLEGRNTASNSEKAASEYIASEFEEYGVKPFGDNGTFFQTFKVKTTRLNPSSKITLYDLNGIVEADFLPGKDFGTQPGQSTNLDLLKKKLGIVFASYGITADEYEYDDYADIDAKDNVVILLMGEPYSENEEFFKGEEKTEYSSLSHKIRNATEKGAAGLLVVPGEEIAQWWDYLLKMTLDETMSIVKEETQQRNRLPGAAISFESLEKIFSGEEYEFSEINKTLEEKEIPYPFELKRELVFNFDFIDTIKTVRNVVGIIEGTDPELKNEYVTIGAHYDHVGVTDGKVYNGADDNGSGTVGVMEAARNLTSSKNKKSIVMILYTGEEKGLLGSNYFVENFKGIDDVSVNINIDMCGRKGIDTIFCIGSDRTSKELDDMVKKVNSNTVNFYLDYSLSSGNYFYQSDHYSYVKKEIPVVFFNDNMMLDLHKPSDDYDKINYEKICKTAKLVEHIAIELANLDHKLARIEKGN